jgi:hypothetical protein
VPLLTLQVLGTYRMDYDYADIIETGAGQGNGHYEYLQVSVLCGDPAIVNS